jgi:cobalt-zinc-cadmium efflux system membrane fusion protein
MSVSSNQGNLVEQQPVPPPRALSDAGLSRFAVLARAVPPLLICSALGGLLLWGHHTGWAVPKFSEMFGPASAAKQAWCAEHGVPAAICVECNEDLLPRLKSTWCSEHGVHYCPFEHPEVAQTRARPIVALADLERARRALALKERTENSSRCKTHLRRLQFASQEVMDKMGIDVLPVGRDTVVETVPVSGEIIYEQPRVAPLYSPVAGRVWQVTPYGLLGEEVKQGDVLALVDAAEVGKAKAEFLHAVAQLELKAKNLAAIQTLSPQGAVSEARLREAETAHRAAQVQVVASQQALANLGLPVHFEDVKNLSPLQLGRHLQFLGLPADLVQRLPPGTATANLLAVRASRDGVVTEARVVAGEMTDPSKTLFIVADTRHMWLKLNVRAEDVPYLRVRDRKTGAPGQTVRFRPDGSNREVSGELVWKSTTVDEKTRTVQFRADLPNPEGQLMAHTFGSGRVLLREEKDAIVVPSEAVHWEGDCHIVFVRDKHFLEEGAPKVFHVRSVRPGVDYAGKTEIIAGVLPGELVATSNSAALRAELLKNNLGAG